MIKDIDSFYECYAVCGETLNAWACEDHFISGGEYYEYLDSIIYSGQAGIELTALALNVAMSDKEKIEVVKFCFKDLNLTDDDVVLMYAFAISKIIGNKLNERNAVMQGYEYESNPDMIDYYGTEKRAFNEGYDNYYYDSQISDYDLVCGLINNYTDYKEANKSK